MELSKELETKYLTNWQNCTVDSIDPDVKITVDLIEKNRGRYQKVADQTGVLWYIIGVIHAMEADFDFTTHLHNGDPLTARTVSEPPGRPVTGTPPFVWEESAVDALNYDRADGVKFWNLPTSFWYLEGFNGWGYRQGLCVTTPPDHSPYIYSKTNLYQKGKYVRDGECDPNFISDQVGCMAQLRELENRGLIQLTPPSINPFNPSTVGSVEAWQHILNGCGYFPVLWITGNMDAETVAMTKRFQADLSLTVTGTVDLLTWQASVKHKKLKEWVPIVPPLANQPQLPQRQPEKGATATGSITQNLYNFYHVKENYDAVYDDVMSWYGTTSNGCTAFVSTALRLSGYDVPIHNNADGVNISLWTAALSEYLQDQGWSKFIDTDNLEPGDVVFTDDGGFGDGIPMHVYMFAGWDGSANGVAWVLDNQGFKHQRNIYAGGGGFNFTPFAYFVRD